MEPPKRNFFVNLQTVVRAEVVTTQPTMEGFDRGYDKPLQTVSILRVIVVDTMEVRPGIGHLD